MNTEKRAMSATTDGKSPREGYEDAAAPAPIRADGQHEAYWVLKEEERAKGFVRPVRDSYRHVGVRPTHPLRDLTDDEKERYAAFNYVAFEAYPPDGRSSVTGRYWTKSQLESGCGAITTMGRALAETYARDPGYYGSTFCCKCGTHLPVGAFGEFEWLDGQRVGT